MSESGSITWPSQNNPLWRLNYTLADAPDEEGLAITSARYQGHQVFYKASLPSLRVQYDRNACGPYKDPLTYNNAKPLVGSNRVKVYTVISGGLWGVAVEAFHTIGAYKLTERWTFWADGRVTPRLFSAGLQCNTDHRHHAYWRFDFDIDGAPRDTVFEYNTSTPDLGWGPGWHVKHHEISRVKNAPTQRSWAVMDMTSTRGYHILPGPDDGTADSFSTRDLWLIRYRAGEDKHGNQGSASDDGLAAYLVPGETIEESDVVVWYAAHLGHHAEPEHADEYHSCGPTLVPFRW
jgi:Cu2+-containing amine oxidase